MPNFGQAPFYGAFTFSPQNNTDDRDIGLLALSATKIAYVDYQGNIYTKLEYGQWFAFGNFAEPDKWTARVRGVLLPDGKVVWVYISHDETTAALKAVVWDPDHATNGDSCGTPVALTGVTVGFSATNRALCACIRPDGKVQVAVSTVNEAGNGRMRVAVFDPATETWAHSVVPSSGEYNTYLQLYSAPSQPGPSGWSSNVGLGALWSDNDHVYLLAHGDFTNRWTVYQLGGDDEAWTKLYDADDDPPWGNYSAQGALGVSPYDGSLMRGQFSFVSRGRLAGAEALRSGGLMVLWGDGQEVSPYSYTPGWGYSFNYHFIAAAGQAVVSAFGDRVFYIPSQSGWGNVYYADLNPFPIAFGVSASGTTATVTWTFYSYMQYAQSHYRVVLSGTTSQDTGWVSGSAASHQLTGLPNGTYTVTVYVREATTGLEGSSTSSSFTISTGGGGGGDTTAPTVGIVTPAPGAMLRAGVTIEVSATDNVGVVGVALEVDGLAAGVELTAANSGINYSWTLATEDWTNGQHTIAATARDAAGNTSHVQISVTIDNSLAANTLSEVWRTEPSEDFPEDSGLLQLAAELPGPPVDPRRRYNASWYFKRGAGSRELSAYAPIIPDVPFPTSGTGGFNVGLLRQPQVALSSWDCGSETLERIAPLEVGGYACLCLNSDKVRRFLPGAGFVDLFDAAGLGATDLACMGDKVLVAAGTRIRVFDTTASDLSFDINEVAGVAFTSVDALVSCASGTYIAATIGGAYKLYLLTPTFSSLTLQATLPAKATRLFFVGATVFVGMAGGQIGSLAGGTWAVEEATGADEVGALSVVGTSAYAGTAGVIGHVWRRDGVAWSDLGALTAAGVRAIGGLGGLVHAAGVGGSVYRMSAAGLWSVVYNLADTVTIRDGLGLIDTNTSVEMILMGSTGDAGNGRMWVLEQSPDAGLVSGPGDAAFYLDALRRKS